jgi:hypothetical protein
MYQPLISFIGSFTALSPTADLFRADAAFATILAQFGFVHCRCLKYRIELIAGTLAFWIRAVIWQQLSCFSGLVTPVLQGSIGDTFFLPHFGNRLIIGWQQLAQDGFATFR